MNTADTPQGKSAEIPGETAPVPQSDPKLTRRKWFRRVAATSAAVTAAILGDTFYIEPHWVEFVQRDLPIRHLPAHWQGKRLIQISDLHVGPRVSDAYLIETFQRIAAWEPDIVVATGDYVTRQHKMGRDLLDQVQRVYAHLPPGKTATVGILGNHDYGLHWADADLAWQVSTVLTESGLHLLRNESVRLNGLTVVGLDDLWASRCDGAAAFAGTSADGARLALCHNPDAADQDHWADFEGWILSGHTHGGQCKPPFLPPPLLPVANSRYTAGEFELPGERRIYINRGLGHLRPVRFNCRPEVTVFRLVTS
ncbi:MAG: metallophosphoesterase [Planctomycetes bacterium]|nr:metallophosphoesterase [Planctomycetota bacterium]